MICGNQHEGGRSNAGVNLTKEIRTTLPYCKRQHPSKGRNQVDAGSEAATLSQVQNPKLGICTIYIFAKYKKVDIRLPKKREKNPMAQGRSTELISMIKWIQTSMLSIQDSLCIERLVIYCQTTGVSTAHATHCATYHILYPVSAAHTSIFRIDSNFTSYLFMYTSPQNWCADARAHLKKIILFSFSGNESYYTNAFDEYH